MTINTDLTLEIRDNIGIVTFNRPQSRNALTFSMYQRLADICTSPPGEVDALVITGAGQKAFAAGTDISQFRQFTTEQHAIDYEATIDQVLGQIECCRLPTVAAINGACTGGGAAIAGACDIRIASDNLRFGFPIARTLGNCLSAVNLARLASLIGAGRVREIIFTCRLIEAAEAERIGLVSEICENPAVLETRAFELAQKIASHAPLTLQATKEIQRRLAAQNVKDRDWIVKCYTSDDFHEGLDAFLTKRQPDWQGK